MARSDDNPYAPPRPDDAPPESDRDDRPYELASRGQRLLGAVIDTIFNLALVYALRAVAAAATDGSIPSFMEASGPGALQNKGFGGFAVSLVPFGFMAALIAWRGQSVGKIVMLTRIVTLDGRKVGLSRGFVLRTLPLTGLALIPSLMLALGSAPSSVQPLTLLTSLLSLADVVTIFGDDRRCLHDRIAGTVVAKVGTERPTGDAPRRRKKKRRAAAPVGPDAG